MVPHPQRWRLVRDCRVRSGRPGLRPLQCHSERGGASLPVANRGGTETIDSQHNNFADGNWHHVAIVLQEDVGQSMYVDAALSSHGENLIIVRAGSGRFYLPAYEFNDIDRFREGKVINLELRKEQNSSIQMAGLLRLRGGTVGSMRLGWQSFRDQH